MKKIGVIIASTREGRVGRSIAEYVLTQVTQSPHIVYDLIDLKAENLPFNDEPMPAVRHQYQHAHTLKWSQKINSYDGFVIVTPEYNHGYPAPLKNALDMLYIEWNDKPVALVGYGYSASGTRSIEQLRQVLTYLQLKPVWREVNINLATVLKEGVFHGDDGLNEATKAVLADLEKALA